MRHELVGYIVGALDENDCQDVEAHLANNERLRRDLHLLRRAIEPLDAHRRHIESPPGLARRTCEYVDTVRAMVRAPGGGAASSKSNRAGQFANLFDNVPAPPTRSWGLADVAVAAGIVIATALLVLPAISHSRFNAQVAACQNKLATIGAAIHRFAENDPGQRIPSIDVSGKLSVAGVFAARLRESGYITDANLFLCAGSGAGCEKLSTVPTLKELKASDADAVEPMLAKRGGSFAYNLGYYEDGEYRTVSLRDPPEATFVLMADAPCKRRGELQSSNHSGLGQNVLLFDGRVEFCRSCRTPGCRDTDFYHNDDGEVAAGKHRDDSVVGGCCARPCKRP